MFHCSLPPYPAAPTLPLPHLHSMCNLFFLKYPMPPTRLIQSLPTPSLASAGTPFLPPRLLLSPPLPLSIMSALCPIQHGPDLPCGTLPTDDTASCALTRYASPHFKSATQAANQHQPATCNHSSHMTREVLTVLFNSICMTIVCSAWSTTKLQG